MAIPEATGFGVLGIVGLIDLALGLANLVRIVFRLEFSLWYGAGSGQVEWTFVSLLAGLASLIATSVFLVSFALGLADPSDDLDREEMPRTDGPAWPEPGGEPPTYGRPSLGGSD